MRVISVLLFDLGASVDKGLGRGTTPSEQVYRELRDWFFALNFCSPGLNRISCRCVVYLALLGVHSFAVRNFGIIAVSHKQNSK